MERLLVANAVLECFAPGSEISWLPRKGWCVSWPTGKGIITRAWQRQQGQDFYPVWSHKWPHGGTATTALSQLIRWLRDLPVLPLGTWRYWTGDKIALGRDNGAKIVDLLLAGNYPEEANCVLCGNEIAGSLDWWSLEDVSGPCCHWGSGCRQKGKLHQAEATVTENSGETK